jgi:hypothetical protein
MKLQITFFSLCLLAVAPLGHAEQFYKWTDAQGVVHYTKTPPPDAAAQAKSLTINSAPASVAVTPAAAGTADAAAPDNATPSAQSKAEAEAEKERKRQLCAQARRELEYSTSNGGRRVMEVRGDEKRIVLPAERKQEADKWRGEIARNCE